MPFDQDLFDFNKHTEKSEFDELTGKEENKNAYIYTFIYTLYIKYNDPNFDYYSEEDPRYQETGREDYWLERARALFDKRIEKIIEMFPGLSWEYEFQSKYNDLCLVDEDGNPIEESPDRVWIILETSNPKDLAELEKVLECLEKEIYEKLKEEQKKHKIAQLKKEILEHLIMSWHVFENCVEFLPLSEEPEYNQQARLGNKAYIRRLLTYKHEDYASTSYEQYSKCTTPTLTCFKEQAKYLIQAFEEHREKIESLSSPYFKNRKIDQHLKDIETSRHNLNQEIISIDQLLEQLALKEKSSICLVENDNDSQQKSDSPSPTLIQNSDNSCCFLKNSNDPQQTTNSQVAFFSNSNSSNKNKPNNNQLNSNSNSNSNSSNRNSRKKHRSIDDESLNSNSRNRSRSRSRDNRPNNNHSNPQNNRLSLS